MEADFCLFLSWSSTTAVVSPLSLASCSSPPVHPETRFRSGGVGCSCPQQVPDKDPRDVGLFAALEPQDGVTGDFVTFVKQML